MTSPPNEQSSLLSPTTTSNPKLQIAYKRLRYYIPAFEWIPSYSSDDFLQDAVAGVTLACLLIPQSIGYASQLAGIPSVNGLFSAAIPAITYPLLCTGRHVSVGPEAALSLLVGQLVKQLVQHRQLHSPSDFAPSDDELLQLAVTISTIVTFESGLITFLFGFFRLGFLDAILSRALLRGFVSAIAIVIAIEQLIPILGLSALEHAQGISSEGAVEKLIWTLSNLKSSHRMSCLISLVSFCALIAIRSFKTTVYCRSRLPLLKYVPDILIIAGLAAALTDIFNWDQHGVAVVGSIHASQVKLGLPWRGIDKHLLKDTLGTAITICICGFVDSIVAAKGESSRFHYPISPNRELVALGAANIVTSFVSGDMPAYGSITRSRLNASTGARTPMASVITGLTILFATYFLLDYLFFLPKCVLAVVVTMVVFHLISELPEDLAFFWKLRGWTELALMTFTFLITLVYEVKTGIIMSVAVSMVLTIKDATAIRVRILGKDPISQSWEPIDPLRHEAEAELETDDEIPGVLIVKIRESLSFANAGRLKEKLRRLEMYGYRRRHPSDERERDQTRMLVFHLGDVEKIDASALQIFKEIVVEYKMRDVEVWICHVIPNRLVRFEKAGILAIVGKDRILPNVNEVLKRAQKIGSQTNSQAEVDIMLRDEHDEDLPI
ncbi:uncharacterized protein MELLADRAFT_77271 [Melampsora larici-populina 98AG31]|uniref:STAS domain-containing protein n=1 Tax=Melampsora larici-populina (strain 98AG31 / pathotype 3-4-7) TaxID=747676 RepID=F4RFL9_MELLP|nr:uncharacterized protein MELLADRAFT_77271 [Melampsora larici-populina 98AG31]EGG08907.1 hypothetical protein MELLADRAFT_77271 [Melampsora larici-populina 98AG31]